MWSDLEFFHLYGWIDEVKKVINDYNAGLISAHQYNLILEYKRKELQEYEEKVRTQKSPEREGLQE